MLGAQPTEVSDRQSTFTWSDAACSTPPNAPARPAVRSRGATTDGLAQGAIPTGDVARPCRSPCTPSLRRQPEHGIARARASGELDLSKARQVTYQGRAAYEVPIRASHGHARQAATPRRSRSRSGSTARATRRSPSAGARARTSGAPPTPGLRAAPRRRRPSAAAELRLSDRRPGTDARRPRTLWRRGGDEEDARRRPPGADPRRSRCARSPSTASAARRWRTIAAEAGLSEPGLLHHFASKRELLFGVLQETEARVQGVGAANGSPTAAATPSCCSTSRASTRPIRRSSASSSCSRPRASSHRTRRTSGSASATTARASCSRTGSRTTSGAGSSGPTSTRCWRRGRSSPRSTASQLQHLLARRRPRHLGAAGALRRSVALGVEAARAGGAAASTMSSVPPASRNWNSAPSNTATSRRASTATSTSASSIPEPWSAASSRSQAARTVS